MGEDVLRGGARDSEASEGSERVRGASPTLGGRANTTGVVGALPAFLSKDYEKRPASEEAIILIAMINLMVHRLEPD